MTSKFSLLLTAGALMLLAPLTSSHAQRYVRGGGGRFYQPGYGGYYGNRGGYYGGRHRYFYRGSYYFYDPFFFGGFGYPGYYGGYGPGYGFGYYGPPAGYDGYPGERVYGGRIASDADGGARRGDPKDSEGGRDGRYSPGSMSRAVQTELKQRGYYRGPVDGEFGASTATALRSFQREKGLKVTGRLDERTLKALGFDER